ncbi:glucosylceramidase [Bacteroidia bacterium]|nr:glucosylceramidase [Bacteroidia bacterium]
MNKFKNIPALILLTVSLISCSSDRDKKTDEKGDNINRDTVTAYVTTGTRSAEFAKQEIAFSSTADNMSPLTITLNPTEQFQSMDGFGAAITGSTAYNLLKMSQEDRSKFLKETFSESEGMGQNYVRISIGCSDFSLSEYTCCDKKGIENFALQDEELKYVIPALKEILAINPNLRIMGSPWTPPLWMKVNNLKELKPYESWTSGQLNPVYYQDYAAYFVRWIEAMKANGINIYSITPQNEPLNRGNSASMFMGCEEQNIFVRDALGPKFKEAGLTTKIYLYDHNYDYDNNKEDTKDQGQYPLKIYKDAETAKYVAGAAYHNYGGDKAELLTIHNANPEKELVFTETSIGTWNDGRNFEKRLIEDMEEIALGTVNNWCKGVIVWNLMLDSERGPFRPGGCDVCYGAVDINKSDYKSITRNSHYFIVGHLSSVVKYGAVRIGTSGYTDSELIYSAFKNPDDSYAFIILNKSATSKRINLYDGVRSFVHEVPAKAVVSYRWSNK